MSVDDDRIALRAQYAPNVILCNECEGHGTHLVQKEAKDWWDRSTKACYTCQETGLKGIPESEVNEVRVK